MQLLIYLCQYVHKNYWTLQFNLGRSVNQTVVSGTVHERGAVLDSDISALSVSVIYSGDSSPLMLPCCSCLEQNNVYTSKTVWW